MRYISPRRIVLLAALLLLIAPWASAAPPHGSSSQPARISEGIGIPDLLSLAWRLITGGWSKEGCQIDPSGRCLPIKTGCQIDPSGHCLSGLSTTTPLSSSDLGCQIDPGGRCIS